MPPEEDDNATPADAETPEGEGEDGEGGPKKKGKSKLLIIIIAAVLLIGGAGGGAFFFIGGGEEEGAAAGGEVGEDGETPGVEVQTAFYELPEIVVNVQGMSGENHFLKTKLSIELANAADLPAFEQVKPRVIDDFNTYLRQMRTEDFRTSAAAFRLKQGLLRRANQSAYPIRIKSVLVQELLVQ